MANGLVTANQFRLTPDIVGSASRGLQFNQQLQQAQLQPQIQQLRQQALGGDQAALTQLGGIAPDAAQQVQTLQAGQAQAGRLAEEDRFRNVIQGNVQAQNLPLDQRLQFFKNRRAELISQNRPTQDTDEQIGFLEAGDLAASDNIINESIRVGGQLGFVDPSKISGQKRVQSTRPTEGGTLITFSDGTQEFKALGQKVITAEQQAAQRDLPKLNAALQTKSVNLQQDANDSFGLSEKAANLSKRFAAADIAGGTSAEVSEAFSRVVGGQDALSSLRQEFTRIRNKLITQNLPQGPATDRDIELIAEGFPKGTANKQQITEFLNAMSRGQEALAKFSEFQSAFLIENGNITRATRDFEFDGQQVKKGERLNSAYKRVSKALTSKADELSPEEQSELAQLEQQFGGQ